MEQFDIKEFAQMFDAALASDNPAVKKALRNFMMVAAIVHAQELNEDERLAGPFESLLKKVQDLDRVIHELKTDRMYSDSNKYYYQKIYDNTPWYNPNTSVTTSTTRVKDSWTAMYNGQTVKSDELYNLLKDLKST